MNFVFISPNFPESFRWFCVHLKENGVNVLGLGDAPYDSLAPELKQALTEYYRVDSLQNYDQVLRGVGYFTGRYGKMDWIESNNEYWLELDAALRTDFNVTTGLKKEEIGRFKSKLAMKKYFAKAGVVTPRSAKVTTLARAMSFAAEVGYPMVAKPDNGVGANGTYKIMGETQLRAFFADKPQKPYLLEEYVTGEVTTYDGVCNSKGEVLFAASHITPGSIMDMLNEGAPTYYYVNKTMPADVEKAGKAVLAAFDVRARAFHLEFFRLTEAKRGLGEVGDLVALEVNMRPAGGYTADMINYSQSVDLFGIWADMVAFDECRHTYQGPKSYCVYVGRRDSVSYALSLPDLQAVYSKNARLFARMPQAVAGAMGNQAAIACFDTLPQVQAFVKRALADAPKMLAAPAAPAKKKKAKAAAK